MVAAPSFAPTNTCISVAEASGTKWRMTRLLLSFNTSPSTLNVATCCVLSWSASWISRSWYAVDVDDLVEVEWVAVPLVARPALLVLALGAGADQGMLVAVGAMGIAIASLTGLAAWWPTEGPAVRVLRWGSCLAAALLVACGVILTVDGVLDV